MENSSSPTSNKRKNKPKKIKSQIVKKEFKDESVFSENPSLVENWKGLGKRSTSSKRRIGLNSIPLLFNGTRTRTGIKDVLVSNTCAFDAVSQIIAVGCVDGFNLSTSILNSDNMYCQFVKAMIVKNSKKQYLYKRQAEILGKFFDNKVSNNNITHINCECSVTYIFDKILIDSDIMYSAERIESCPLKKVSRKIAFIPIDTNVCENISLLNKSAQDSLSDDVNIVECRRNNCKGIRTFSYILHNTVSFVLSQSERICLDDVPRSITLNDNTHSLLGIIEFLPSGPKTDKITCIGHYRSHCFRGKRWECYDDLRNHVTKSYKCMIAECIIYGLKSCL